MGKLFQESGGTASDRRNEADRIIEIVKDYCERMTSREQNFVEQISEGGSVSPNQLFWLRDIKSKYAE